jgi:hypothetical protein
VSCGQGQVRIISVYTHQPISLYHSALQIQIMLLNSILFLFVFVGILLAQFHQRDEKNVHIFPGEITDRLIMMSLGRHKILTDTNSNVL